MAGRYQPPLLLRPKPGSDGQGAVQVTLHTTHIDWFGLGTVFALIGASFLALLCAVLVPRAIRRVAAASISAAGFVVGIVLSVWLYVDSTHGHTIVSGAFYRDRWTAVATQSLTGDTFVVVGIALIVAGLGFKMSAAPFHMWTPDVYEGAPTTVTAWMSSATKVAALLLAFRLMTTAFPHDGRLWGWAFAIVATASLAIGNFAALVQRNVKRILAYSSISHAGFMLIALSTGSALGGRALMYYLVPYSAMAFGSFTIVAARERELGVPVTLENLAGFGWERPFLGVAMWFFMFGFAGLPLGGGFVGKFYVFAAAYRHGWVWLVIVGVLATLVSLYYYLGIVRAMYMRPSAELAIAGGSPPRERLLHIAVGAALAV